MTSLTDILWCVGAVVVFIFLARYGYHDHIRIGERFRDSDGGIWVAYAYRNNRMALVPEEVYNKTQQDLDENSIIPFSLKDFERC